MTREKAPEAWSPAKQEEAEFADFFRDEWPRVIRTLMMLGATAPEAEDATQAVFLDIYKRWKNVTYPSAYVKRAAIHQFIKMRSRSQQRILHRLVAQETPSEIDATADRDLTVWEDQQWVEQVLDSLTPTQREVMAFIMDGLSSKEIAETMSKSEGNVRQHLSLARERLRKSVDEGDG